MLVGTQFYPWAILLGSLCATANAATSIVSTADSKLPQSLVQVVSDLERFDGNLAVATGCFLPSRSVTLDERVAVLERLLDAPVDPASLDAIQAWTTSAGLALVQPNRHSCHEVVTAAAYCDSILYYPSTIDLQRGEGLLDSLAPVLERLSSDQSTTLYVLVDSTADVSMTRRALNDAAAVILGSSLDTYNVVYTTPETVGASLSTTALSHVVARTTQSGVVSSSSSTSSTTLLTPVELVSVQTLAPLGRSLVADTMALIKEATTADDGSNKLVLDFGALCDAAIAQASMQLDTAIANSVSTNLVAPIQESFQAELQVALSEPLAQQVELLRLTYWEEFKRNVSKLLVSPNLQSDMESVASKSTAALVPACRKLVPRIMTSRSSTNTVTLAYARRVKETIANRILTARASGKFRPVPRKGLTVGLHWLLPKPFGNDYRQEPWMVHATDNMVYVPQNKLADVNPESVATGDWRDKIVPSPSGNDMLYMQ